ncbi:putative Protein NOV-like protein [Hypsibius exemplaris]|uniref:Connective tissue growth factor n=1 Tax=Hypsibius exemplaris TaxID=2072580 RepID=A0A9X6NAF5_HYPEX|nr:putative Protein NOV-like protein [Hypsibius exemplaris]
MRRCFPWEVVLFLLSLAFAANSASGMHIAQQNGDDNTPGIGGGGKCPDKCHPCAAKEEEECQAGVKLRHDACGCCPYCARQEGEECNAFRGCQNGLLCSNGTCRPEHPRSCIVGKKTYAHDESWRPNCQTICQCENGVYGCSDVCQPDVPASECLFGRQILVESRCCSRWVCRPAEPSVSCTNVTLDWTSCSCKHPISQQWTNKNPDCKWTVQQKDCPAEECPQPHAQNYDLKNLITDAEALSRAKHFCEKSLYHRYEFITEDNCRSTRMHHQKTCASECHMPDGRKLCCLPNEFESMPVRLRCGNHNTVLRTLAVISGCNCVLC